jgi:transcriptional regulator PpsR
VKPFRTPIQSLGNLDAESAASLIAAASDIVLILNGDGIVSDVAIHDEDLARDLPDHSNWPGQPWAATVALDSQPKVAMLLRDAPAAANLHWRHINYPAPSGADVPILYSAVMLRGSATDQDTRIVAFGRDLRAMSVLQQRLVSAQQSLERDFSRTRHIETRYRLLLQTSVDCVIILDAGTRKVVEANPPARALLGDAARRAAGVSHIFTPDSVAAIQALLATILAAGRPDDVLARLADTGQEVTVRASLFREESAIFFLVRISPLPAASGIPKLKAKLLKLVESAPDGFVVTGTDGRVITGNAAFVQMAELTSEDQARGELLSRWLGRPGVELGVLIANLLQHGSVRLFATTLQGEYGAQAEVEISAVSVMNGGQPCFGFAIRNVGRRLAAPPADRRVLPRSIEQLTGLIGRVKLKELVRETTEIIERLCIETALEMTDDNRASAAEMLGLSRQSLYLKLRRYGLGDLAAEGTG